MKKLILISGFAAASLSCTANIDTPLAPKKVRSGALQIRHADEVIHLELRTSQNLFAPGFARFELRDGDLRRIGGIPADAHCYKLGRSPDHDITVAVRSCVADHSDAHGVAFVGGRAFDVAVDDDGLARLTTPVGKSGECGVEHPTNDAFGPPTTDFETTRHALNELPRFIESIVVQDTAWFAQRDAGTPVADPVMTAHAAAALYDGTTFNDRVLPILTGVIDTGGTNPWGDPSGNRVNSSTYLDAFNDWLDGSVASLPRFDHAALMTGYDMGSTIGLAVVEGSCDPLYAGALVYSLGSNAYAAQTMAHEYGHLLGMWHDGEQNNCPVDTHVMTPSYYEDGPFPTDFSNCSIDRANAFLDSAVTRCINEEAGSAFPEPRCGDGKIEGDEQCDCGPDGCAGRDPCCDASTCRLAAGARCSVFDGCCDPQTCEPYGADENVVCRDERSSCDVEEICDGGATCPVDRVVASGTACTDDSNWSGACFLGDCVTRGSFCEALTEYYVLDDPPYAPMCGMDAGCGPTECLGGGECVVTEDPPPDGTSCGNGMQCYEGSCVASANVPGADGCGNPDQDFDGDGTADCYDACPRDAATVEEPCEERDVDPNGNNANNGSTNNGTMQTSGGSETNNDTEEDDVIIVRDPGGCSTTGGNPTAWLVGVFAFFAFRRRR